MSTKVWGEIERAAVGLSQERALARLETPYLSASNANGSVKKRLGSHEVNIDPPDNPKDEEPIAFMSGWTTVNGVDKFAKKSTHDFKKSFVTKQGFHIGDQMGKGYQLFGHVSTWTNRFVFRECLTGWDEHGVEIKSNQARGFSKDGSSELRLYKRGKYIQNVAFDSLAYPDGLASYGTSFVISRYREVAGGYYKQDNEWLTSTIFIGCFMIAGVEDDYGFPCAQPVAIITYGNFTSAISVKLPIPSDTKTKCSYLVGDLQTLSPGEYVFYAAELFSPVKLDTGTTTPKGRVLRFYSNNWGQSWSSGEVSIASDLPDQPTPTTDRSKYVDYHPTSAFMSAINFSLNGLVGTLTSIVVSPTRMAVCFTYNSKTEGVKTEFKFSNDKGATFQTANLPFTSSVFELVGIVVHGNTLFARATDGIGGYGPSGINRTVRYIRSIDGGASWSLVNTGLPTLNQNVGYPKVIEAKKGDKPAKMVIPVWDYVTNSTILKVSTDDGSSWKRMSNVASSDHNWRIDEDLVPNDGGNFSKVEYLGTRKNPAPLDVAVPWKYEVGKPYTGDA